MAKLVIFKSKYRKQLPNVQYFWSRLKLEEEKEEKCARNMKAGEKFMSKWANLPRILSASSETSPLHTPSQSIAQRASTNASHSPAYMSTQTSADVVAGRRRPSGGRVRDAPVSVVSPARPDRRGPPCDAAVEFVVSVLPRPRQPRRSLAEAHPV